MTQELTKIKLDILQQVWKDSPFDGWNEITLKEATQKIKPNIHYKLLFENGIFDLTEFMNETINQQMAQEFVNFDVKEMPIRMRIHELIKIRLELLAAHKEAVRALYGFLAIPKNLFFTKKLIWQISDEMWHLALDKSTDYNHYSKRGLLSIIYNASINFWLQDESENHQKTNEFIYRAIDGVMKINKVKKLFKKIPQFAKKIPFLRKILV